ncbi:MAG: hypothetical protein WC253_07495 [Sulfurovaceae bacterium]|nr:hypothetical protein [Sulfurovaceae bacterium]
MSKIAKIIQEINLHGTTDGSISIGIIDEPYGADSQSVASIGISLQSSANEPDWKVHIPKENIDAVISALHEAKKEL